METVWNIKRSSNFSQDQDLESQISDVLDIILQNRQITDREVFLNPPPINDEFLDKVWNLFDNKINQAVQIIEETKQSNRSIVIHGDYDVDGVSATAVLWETLYYHREYKKVFPFIPHRVDHGYGLSQESIDDITKMLHQKNEAPGLLITVDCGVTAKEAVEYAKTQGYQIIITDHHTLPNDESTLPLAEVILHTYELCGCGISWALSQALLKNSEQYLEGVDLVALATLADAQPVTGLNRSLVIHGLEQLTFTKRLGLQALYQQSGIMGKPIGTYEVGWVIGPRINATGRLEHALDALRLLVVRNQRQAFSLAEKLQILNGKRQGLTSKAVDQAIQLVDQQLVQGAPIFVSHKDWHEGIIGLIAAKLVERYDLPALVVSKGESLCKGSARSIEGVNVVELLRNHEGLMESVGGHEMAAGFSVLPKNLEALHTEIGKIELFKNGDIPQKTLQVDAEIPVSAMSWKLWEALQVLKPFGVGNQQPVFASRDVQLKEVRTVGATGDHLKLTLANGLGAIGFGMGERLPDIENQPSVNIAYTVEEDTYRGGKTIQLKLKDLKVTL